VQQKAAARYRNELNEKLAKCALDKDTALRQLKEQYAARISDAETKSRLHKKATAQIEELEATVRRLEREKSELMSAKATVEKELEDRENEAKGLQGYQEAYNQVVEERDQLQSEYYDVVAERDELRQAQGALGDASDQQNIPAGGQTTSILQTGTLQSYDNDLGLLKNYWTRQENFAEMAMRETAAEIRDVEAQIEEAVRQLRLLDTPDNASDAETDATDPESETEVEPQPSAESSRFQLLDTLTQPLPTPSNLVQTPQPTARVATAGPSRPTTWASKAAKAKDSDKGTGRDYVHASYHGHGVSTVRWIDSSDMQK
jgi:myosin heavy subunit